MEVLLHATASFEVAALQLLDQRSEHAGDDDRQIRRPQPVPIFILRGASARRVPPRAL